MGQKCSCGSLESSPQFQPRQNAVKMIMRDVTAHRAVDFDKAMTLVQLGLKQSSVDASDRDIFNVCGG
jgi:hypothetical protein